MKPHLSLIWCFGTGLLMSPVVNATCQLQYKLSINTETTFFFKSNTFQRINLNGILNLKPLNDDKQGQWWGVKGDNIELSSQGAKQMDNDYTIHFALKRAKNGLIVDFWFTRQTSPKQQEKLKGLVYNMQFRYSNYQGVATENDGVGQYIAHYQHKNNQIIKAKQQYQLSMKESRALDSVDIIDSNSSALLDKCWLTDIKVKETLAFNQLDNRYKLTVKQRYQLTPTKQRLASDLWALPNDTSKWPEIKPIELTLAQKEKLAQEFNLFLKQKSLVEIEPHELARLLVNFAPVFEQLRPLLVEGTFSENDNMRLYHALGLVDNPQSQQFLMSLLDSTDTDNTNKFRAIQALSQGSGTFDQKAYEQLVHLMDSGISDDQDLNNSLIYAAGAMIQFRKDDPLMQSLQTRLQDNLANALTPESQTTLIVSLTNTNSVDNVSHIQDFQSSGSAQVRRSVAKSFGQLHTPESFNTLSTMYGHESNTRVKTALISSLGNYELTREMTSQINLIAKESRDHTLRKASIDAMAKQIQYQANVKDDLRALLSSEKSRQNFESIVKAINSND